MEEGPAITACRPISAVATPIHIKAAEGRVKPSKGQFPLELYPSL